MTFVLIIYFAFVNAVIAKYIGGGVITFFFGKGRRMLTSIPILFVSALPVLYLFNLQSYLTLVLISMILQVTFRTGEIGHMFMIKPWYNEIKDRERFASRPITTSYGRFLSKMPNAYVAYMIRVGLQLFLASTIIYSALIYFGMPFSWIKLIYLAFLSMWAGLSYPISRFMEKNRIAVADKNGIVISISNAETFFAEIEVGAVIGIMAFILTFM